MIDQPRGPRRSDRGAGPAADRATRRLQAAARHRQGGRLDEAAAVCRVVLETAPERSDAVNLLGVVLMDQGRLDDALDCFRRVLARQADHAEALYNTGVALRRLGRLDEAAAGYRAAAAAKPDFAEAHHGLGLVLRRQGDAAAAEAAFRRALAARPDYAGAHRDLGLALVAQGRESEAVVSYRRALALRPDDAGVHNNLGNALLALGKLPPAVSSYGRALALKPGYADALNNLGTALQAQGKWDAAVECYRRALALRPDYPEAHYNLGNALEALGRRDEAVASYRRAIALAPDYIKAYNNLGNALQGQGDLDAAADSFRRGLALDPDFVEAHNNLGNTLQAMGDVAAAIASFERALAVRPDHVDANWNRALAFLLTGDLARGFADYEWRWRLKKFRVRDFPRPAWDGASFAGRRLLLHAEQGFGDTIQFIRYLPRVVALGGEVIVEAQAELIPLLQGLPGIAETVAHGSVLPVFDLHAPLMSLGRIFGTTLATIPAAVPYLAAPAARFALPAPPGTRLKVGIAWAGRPEHKHDRSRSCPVEHFLTLAGRPGVALYSLQKGERAGDIADAVAAGRVHDLGPRLADFADTAAAIAGLDLVISVDTAVAHLAGALGRPLWVALAFMPDWRWLLERADSPWYPTARLFRQPRRGDWADVFARIAAALEAAAPPGEGAAAHSTIRGDA